MFCPGGMEEEEDIPRAISSVGIEGEAVFAV